MLKVQKHRGPDDTGIRFFSLTSGFSSELASDDPAFLCRDFDSVLGFNRLSILDLSQNGHQPMINDEGDVLLALNGEIYNAFDYKNELQEWGYRFKSKTDTEVVLALYLKYGFEGILRRLNGMFAIIIADLKKGEVFLTRDRFGIKPLYFILTESTFAFSSEIKSLKYIENFYFRLCPDQLDEYIIFRNNVRGTLFKDIELLKPGFYLSFTFDKGLSERQFFSINNYHRSNTSTENINFFSKQVKSCLGRSVRSQLMSDVTLGCQLSGGIDSSLVTWFANQNSTKGKFHALSIIFNDDRFNEEKYIDIVTDNLDITAHKFMLDSKYYFENIEKVAWHYEAPINHPNTIAIYKLSQASKRHVTVLLSGEGADEIFGGYSRFYYLKYPYALSCMLHQLKKNNCHPGQFIKYQDPVYRSIMATAFLTQSTAKKLKHDFNEDRALDVRRAIYRNLTGSTFDRQVKYEIQTFLPDLLLRQDKMSMAHSIENRVPFLDNNVVEQSFMIPEDHLILQGSSEGSNTAKYILKQITAEVFGNDFAFRHKMGFGIPIREFLLCKEFTEYLKDKIFPGIRHRGIFNYDIVSRWFADLKDSDFSNVEALWVMISFEIWASIYLDDNG